MLCLAPHHSLPSLSLLWECCCYVTACSHLRSRNLFKKQFPSNIFVLTVTLLMLSKLTWQGACSTRILFVFAWIEIRVIAVIRGKFLCESTKHKHLTFRSSRHAKNTFPHLPRHFLSQNRLADHLEFLKSSQPDATLLLNHLCCRPCCLQHRLEQNCGW